MSALVLLAQPGSFLCTLTLLGRESSSPQLYWEGVLPTPTLAAGVLLTLTLAAGVLCPAQHTSSICSGARVMFCLHKCSAWPGDRLLPCSVVLFQRHQLERESHQCGSLPHTMEQ